MARPGPIVDLHSHILPAIDDGAADTKEALSMVRIAAGDGIGVIAATPHAAQSTPEQILAAVAELNDVVTREGLPVTIVPGSEVMFAADLAVRYRNGRLVSLNNSPYVLIELPLQADWSPFFRQAIFDLQLAGARPILAHAERYRAVQRQPLVLADVIESGVLIQVNAPSILGRLGTAARKTAERLLERQMVHLIASDAHNATIRPPYIHAALERVSAITDTRYADWLRISAAAVLDGVAISMPDLHREPHKRWFDRLRGW